MVSQDQIDRLEMDFLNLKNRLELEMAELNKKYHERGKALNKLWEKGKELRQQIATLQKFCGQVTANMARLALENRLIIPAETGGGTQILVRDLLKQLINESGYDLEFKVLQSRPTKRVRTKPALTITGKQIKK